MRLPGKKSIATEFLLALIIFSLILITGCVPNPEELSPPRITSPIYNGAEVVEVWGFTPKAKVRIYADGADIGGGSCWFSKCTFTVKKMVVGQKITARQSVDGVTSYPTRNEHKVTVQKIPDQYLDPKYKKERLIPPVIDGPLYECQRIVPVKNVVEGALVQVFSPPDLNDPIGRKKTPWNYARPVTTELIENQKIKANQTFLSQKPSDLSKEEIVKAKPEKKDIPKPDVNEASLVVGSDAVEVRNLFIGASVEIYYDKGNTRETIGKNLAKWPNTIFQVQPLKPAWANCPACIKADQSLCEMTITGSGKPVKNSLDPPVIVRPICAGSFEVTVCNTAPNSILKIFLKGNPDKQVGQQGAFDNCTPVTLGGAGGKLILKTGDEIYVTQEIGKVESKSDIVKVVDKSNPVFGFGNGKSCKPCNGKDLGPIFIRDKLTSKNGPVFKASMCGAESASAEIRGPNNALIEKITLTKSVGRKGYFEGEWDWNKIGWKIPKDIPPGKYKATFSILPAGPNSKQDRYFHVTTHGCVELEVLCAHNKYRAQVHAENPKIPQLNPLTWSETLADHAQKWANYLDKTNQFQHDDNIPSNEGENLYAGSASYTAAVDSWASEKKCFKNGIFPDIYNGQCDTDLDCKDYKDWRCAGHYSQIVWRDTKQVGCGMANGIVVCRYSPPGNFTGKKTY